MEAPRCREPGRRGRRPRPPRCLLEAHGAGSQGDGAGGRGPHGACWVLTWLPTQAGPQIRAWLPPSTLFLFWGVGVGAKVAPHRGHCSNSCSPFPSSPSPWRLPVSQHLCTWGLCHLTHGQPGFPALSPVCVHHRAPPGSSWAHAPMATLFCPELSAPRLLLVSRLLAIVSCPQTAAQEPSPITEAISPLLPRHPSLYKQGSVPPASASSSSTLFSPFMALLSSGSCTHIGPQGPSRSPGHHTAKPPPNTAQSSTPRAQPRPPWRLASAIGHGGSPGLCPAFLATPACSCP